MILVATEYCPFCQRCKLALTEKGIAFEIMDMDLTRKAEFPEHLSPYGRVPVLKDGGSEIFESSVINEYLEDAYPEPALLPSDPARRADARFWIDFCDTRLMPAYFDLLDAQPGSERDNLRTKLLDHLSFMENRGLSAPGHAQPYWMGGDIGLVDITFYSIFERFAAVEEFRGVVIPAQLENLHAWLETMRKRPSVQAVCKPREQHVAFFREYYAD